MRKVLVLLLVLALLAGCAAPQPVMVPQSKLIECQNAYQELTARYNEIYNQAVGAALIEAHYAQLEQWLEAEKQISLQLSVENAVLKGHIEVLNSNYDSMQQAILTSEASKVGITEASERLNEQLELAEAARNELLADIGLINADACAWVSDNLTVDEYGAFKKGWVLWHDKYVLN